MEWKKIREAGYLYEINEKGQVRSLKRGTPKLIAPKKDSRGYWSYTFRFAGKYKQMSLNKLMEKYHNIKYFNSIFEEMKRNEKNS